MTSSYNLTRRKDKHIDLYSREPGYATNLRLCRTGFTTYKIGGDETDWKLCMPHAETMKRPKIKRSHPERKYRNRHRLYDDPVDFHPGTHPVDRRLAEYMKMRKDYEGYIQHPTQYDGTGTMVMEKRPELFNYEYLRDQKYNKLTR